MAEHPLGRSPDVKTLAMHHNGKFVGETRAGQYLRGIGKDRHHWHVLGLCSLQPDRAYSCLIALERGETTPPERSFRNFHVKVKPKRPSRVDCDVHATIAERS
ncbi:hypothetical protein N7E70_004665 [Aminobacter sp. NyZ550]|uniref:hypothetical protein n=1 Tax=Aminobacter sp. NyZ550 TaxID=2979870 RepID=UPI0021D5B82D|nr:hypothetical protein [Aminobacter sp. NyZ550]WAX98071.1 hypothetical protein N7E70_004665 [Aminobacter sp. NyZ550]